MFLGFGGRRIVTTYLFRFDCWSYYFFNSHPHFKLPIFFQIATCCRYLLYILHNSMVIFTAIFIKFSLHVSPGDGIDHSMELQTWTVSSFWELIPWVFEFRTIDFKLIIIRFCIGTQVHKLIWNPMLITRAKWAQDI